MMFRSVKNLTFGCKPDPHLALVYVLRRKHNSNLYQFLIQNDYFIVLSDPLDIVLVILLTDSRYQEY